MHAIFFFLFLAIISLVRAQTTGISGACDCVENATRVDDPVNGTNRVCIEYTFNCLPTRFMSEVGVSGNCPNFAEIGIEALNCTNATIVSNVDYTNCTGSISPEKDFQVSLNGICNSVIVCSNDTSARSQQTFDVEFVVDDEQACIDCFLPGNSEAFRCVPTCPCLENITEAPDPEAMGRPCITYTFSWSRDRFGFVIEDALSNCP